MRFLRKVATWIWGLFFEPRVYQPVVYDKDPCWKHMKFKKGCITCRLLNDGS